MGRKASTTSQNTPFLIPLNTHPVPSRSTHRHSPSKVTTTPHQHLRASIHSSPQPEPSLRGGLEAELRGPLSSIHTSCCLLPRREAETCELLLVKRVQQGDGVHVTVLMCMTHDSNVHLGTRLWLDLSGRPCGKKQSGLWLTVSDTLRPPVHKELYAHNDHVSWEAEPTSAKPWMGPQPDSHLDCSLVRLSLAPDSQNL